MADHLGRWREKNKASRMELGYARGQVEMKLKSLRRKSQKNRRDPAE